MSKLVLQDITNVSQVSVINSNFDKIEEYVEEAVLSRANPTDDPNSMEVDLDMNGQRVYNLPEPISPSEAARLQDVQNAFNGTNAANLITFTPTGDIVATNVQAAIVEVDSQMHAGDALIRSDLVDAGSNIRGASLVGFRGNLSYVANTVGYELSSFGVNPLWFGAVGDDVVNDTASMLSAAAFAELAGMHLLLPSNKTFRITSSIPVTALIGVQGKGYTSRINAIGCSAFDFQPSGVRGARARFSDFWVSGDNTAGTIAFDVTTGDGATLRNTGLLFDNVYVSNFEIGWKLTGAWDCTIRHCMSTALHRGVYLYDRNVHIVIEGCRLERTGAVVGTGDCAGIYEESGSLRSEDIQIKNSLIYGFDYGAIIGNALYTNFGGTDFDNCQVDGVLLVTANGTTTVRGCWINTVNGHGVNIAALGSTNTDTIIIEGNQITRQTVGASNGVQVGNNQNAVKVLRNTIRNYNTAIRLDADFTEVSGNTDNASVDSCIIISGSTYNYIHGNKFNTVVNKVVSANTQRFGPNEGCMTEWTGNVVFPAGALSTIITYASLGLPNGPTNGLFTVFSNSPSVATVGATWAIADATQVTVYRTSALGSPAAHSLLIKAS